MNKIKRRSIIEIGFIKVSTRLDMNNRVTVVGRVPQGNNLYSFFLTVITVTPALDMHLCILRGNIRNDE
jgi:hypothetical protein